MRQLNGLELKKFYKKNKKHNKDIVLLLENIQYARNVASIFRTADAVQVSKIILTGISKTPPFGKDLVKASRHKEKSLQWEYSEHTGKPIEKLKKKGYEIVGLEITDESEHYLEKDYPNKICLVLGNETYGITRKTIEKLDSSIYLPMFGKGASLNVGVSVAVALYGITTSR